MLIELAILFVLFAYLVWVNRAVQVFRRRYLFDAPMELAWQAIVLEPGTPFRIPGIAGCEWLDPDQQTLRYNYDRGNIETLCRVIERVEGQRYVLEGAYVTRDEQIVLGTFRSETDFEDMDGRILVTSMVRIARGDFWRGFMLRLSTPMMFALVMRALRPQMREFCAARGLKQSGRIEPLGGLQPILRRIGGWPILLSIAAVIWFLHELGLWAGLALLGTLVIHEAGHFYSMRRHGLQAHAMLIPFFGGMAYSNQPMPSDASDAEMTLMGPAFGFGAAFLMFVIGSLATEGEFWIAAAGLAIFVNGFNLLPVLPLDGGRWMQLVARRYGKNAIRWSAAITLVLGMGVTFYFESILLAVLVLAFSLQAMLTKTADWGRPAMNGNETGLAIAAFVGLVLGHAWLLAEVFDRGSLNDLVPALMAGPFS